MHIGIAAPFTIKELQNHLNANSNNNIPQGLGGTAPTAIALELLKRGRKVSIFTLDPNIEDNVKLKGENLDIYVGKYRKRGRDRMKDGFKIERDFISQSIMEASPDIVNAHWTYEFALGSLNSEVPIIVTARDAPLEILKLDFSIYRIVRLLMAWQVIRKTTNMTAVSQYIANHLNKYFYFTNNIKVIPNGIDTASFRMNRKTKEGSHKFVFFSIANGWGKLKNEKKLLYAFNSVHKKNSQTELWMFGQSHEPGGIAAKWATEKKLNDGVQFLGYIPHEKLMEQLSLYADALIHPSLEESFGNIFIESMFLGLPVVGGKYSGAVPSTLGFGEAGLLVDVRSENEIAEAMLMLSIDRGFAKRLGEAGRAYADSHYRISTVVDQYEQVYSQVLKGSK